MRALTPLALVATVTSLGCMDLVGPSVAFEVASRSGTGAPCPFRVRVELAP